MREGLEAYCSKAEIGQLALRVRKRLTAQHLQLSTPAALDERAFYR